MVTAATLGKVGGGSGKMGTLSFLCPIVWLLKEPELFGDLG